MCLDWKEYALEALSKLSIFESKCVPRRTRAPIVASDNTAPSEWYQVWENMLTSKREYHLVLDRIVCCKMAVTCDGFTTIPGPLPTNVKPSVGSTTQ